jgi:hypothetical protein
MKTLWTELHESVFEASGSSIFRTEHPFLCTEVEGSRLQRNIGLYVTLHLTDEQFS